MIGSYILVIKIVRNKEFIIGKKGKYLFLKGFYIYVGSALNSIENRVKRHLNKKKNFHWHIDYLLQYGKIIAIFIRESELKEECIISKKLEDKFISIPGFGCSDCKCKSHLFYILKDRIDTVMNELKMKSFYNEKI
jgi:Uri superfamily endonuclease